MSMDQTVKFLEAWEESAMNDHGYTRTIDMSSALAEPAQSSQRQQQQPAQQSQAPKRQVIRQLMQEECNDEIVLLEERPSHQPHTAYVQGQTPLASSHHQLQMASQDSHQVSHQVSGHPEQSVTYIISGNNSVHPVSQPGPSPGVVRARAPSQTTTGVVNHGLTHELVRNSPELQQQIQQHIAKHQMNQQQQINAKRAIQMGQRNEQQIKQQQAKQQAQLVLQRAQQRQAEHLQQTTSAQLGYVHNLSQGQVITQAGVIQSPAVRMQKQANIISRESLPKPTTVAQKNIIRPARLVVGDGDQVIRHGVSLPHQGSQGVNVQLLQQIREMTATTRMPTGNTRYVPTPGQNVKTPKKKAPPKPKPIKRNNTLNAEILRQALVAGSSNTARTTNVANTSFVTQAGQPLLIPKGTAAQAVQYYIDSGNASLAGGSRVMQIPAQGQGGRAQTVMVNSQGQPVTSQIVRSNNKTIKVVVPSTQVQQLVVQNSSQDQIMVQSPSQGQMVVQSPSQGQMVVQSPSQGQMVVQSPSQGQMVVQSPSQGQMVVQSPSQGQMVVQSPSQGQMVVQSPSQAQLLLQNPSQAQMVAQSLSQAQMMVQSPSRTQMIVQSSPHTQLVVQSPSQGRMVAQSPSQAQMVVHSSSQAHELSSGSTVVTQNLAYQASPQYQQALIQTNVPSPGQAMMAGSQAMMAGSQVEQSPSCGVRTQSPLVGRGSPLVGRGSQPSFQSPSTGPHHPAPGSAPMALSPVCSQRVSSSSDTNSSKPASPAQQPMSQPKISPLNLHNNAEPEQVMAGKKPKQYVKGQTYAINYKNGVSLEIVWDGKFFKPKGQCNLAGQVAGSTPQTVVASPGKTDQLSPPATPVTELPGCLTPGPQTKKAATMQIVPPIRTLRATKRRGGATAARGAKRKYVRSVAEPAEETQCIGKNVSVAATPRKSTLIKCSSMEVCGRFLTSLGLPGVYFDPKYDQCFCSTCIIARGDSLYYNRGIPPKLYGLPAGWCRFGLNVPAKAHGMDTFTQWHVAFHGTVPNNIRPIIESDNLLMPGDYNVEGVQLEPPSNHFSEDKKPEGFDIKQVFVSPSIAYAGRSVYAKPQKWVDPETHIEHNVKVAIQVRIKPGSYTVGGDTLALGSERIDGKFDNSELEWSTKRRGATVLQGILIKP